jgi:hypothetical protein
MTPCCLDNPITDGGKVVSLMHTTPQKHKPYYIYNLPVTPNFALKDRMSMGEDNMVLCGHLNMLVMYISKCLGKYIVPLIY